MPPARALLGLTALAVAGAVAPDAAALAEALAMPAFAQGVRILSSVDAVLTAPWLLPLSSRAAAAAMDAQPARATFDEVSRAIAAVEADVVTQMAAALTCSHPLSTGAVLSREPAELLAAVEHVSSFVTHPADLIGRRMRVEESLEAARVALAPVNDALRGLMPEWVRLAVGPLDVAVVAGMAASIGWPDFRGLVECLVYGFPTVGECPDSGVPAFRAVERPVGMPDITQMPNAAANAKMKREIESRFKERGDEFAAPLWAKSMAEVAGGTAKGPYTIGKIDDIFGSPDSWRGMVRFAVSQRREDGSWKIRPCDNAAAGGHNDATSLGETITCERADFPTRVAAAFWSHLGRGSWRMQLGTDDIVMAYRRLGNRTPQFGVVVQIDPSSGEARYFITPGLNFGLKAAVNQFNRIPELVVAFLRRRGGVVCTHYFDDYCVAEPDYTLCSGQGVLVRLHQTMRLPLDLADKHNAMAEVGAFLGIEHDFRRVRRDGVAIMRPKAGRLEKILAMMAAILAAGCIAQGQAARLRGHLQFLSSTLLFGGRLARGAISAASRARRSRRPVPIPEGGVAWRAFTFLSLILRRLPARAIDLARLAAATTAPPVIIWSDAMWEAGRADPGGIGFVIFVPPGHPSLADTGYSRKGRYLFGERTITWADVSALGLKERKQQVGQLELLAGVVPYLSARDIVRGCDVIHYVDNTSAVYGLASGSSGQPDSQSIILSLYAEQSTAGFNPWVRYIKSKENVANMPSRGAMDEMEAAIRRLDPTFSLDQGRIPLVMPDLADGWMDRVADALAALAPGDQPRRRRGGARQRRSASG